MGVRNKIAPMKVQLLCLGLTLFLMSYVSGKPKHFLIETGAINESENNDNDPPETSGTEEKPGSTKMDSGSEGSPSSDYGKGWCYDQWRCIPAPKPPKKG